MKQGAVSLGYNWVAHPDTLFQEKRDNFTEIDGWFYQNQE
jgi:hypothetical protein